MTHWTDGPIAAFDLETTSVEVETARIVTYCVGMLQELRGWRAQGFLVNPGVPIPEAATNVHGITDEKAAKGMQAPEAALHIDWMLRQAWRMGAPVVIYNAVYDLTILDRELRRHCGRPLEISGPVIDPLVLDKAVDTYRKGSRRLTDTCKHYGVELLEEDAHSASGDAKAALQLAREIVRRGVMPVNGEKGDMSGKPLAEMELGELYRAQRGAYREQRESFHAYLARKGETPDDMNTVWPLKPWNGDGS